MNGNLYARFTDLQHATDRVALTLQNGSVWRFADLDASAGRIASALIAAGCLAGDRVASQVEKSPEALALYLACLKAGLVFVPINTAYREAETRYLIEDSQPSLVVAAPELERMQREIAPPGTKIFTLDQHGGGSLIEASRTLAPTKTLDCSAEHIALLLYTSGTTGKPKGAMLSHGAMERNARLLRDLWEVTATDVIIHCLPLFHAHGLTVSINCALLAGASMAWLPRFSVEEVCVWLPLASVFMGVPTMYNRLIRSGQMTSAVCAKMRLFTSGSAALSVEALEGFEQLTGHRIIERYGMSETGINASNPLHGPRKAGSVGMPLDGTQLRIVGPEGEDCAEGTPGEVWIASDSLCSGYWGKLEANETSFRDGWFLTGDIGRMDADGYLFLVGRSKDVIITGGYNVYPSEVEAAVKLLPYVQEAAVIGVPDADFGEAVIAVILLEPDGRLDEQVAIAVLKSRIANYKVPKRIIVVESLPRNAMGKVLNAALREIYRDVPRSLPETLQSLG